MQLENQLTLMKTTALFSLILTLPLMAGDQALTIYNNNFAVVRDLIPLSLDKGTNEVTYSGATQQLEPDSVILRDSAGKAKLQILEQSYRADVISQGLLLSLNEGKTLDFLSRFDDGTEQVIKGRVVRSGYIPGSRGGIGAPIIEVDGKLRFSLPGLPLFPSLGDDTILEPALNWKLASDRKADLKAELSYVTNGMSWQSAYNLVLPEKGETIDIVGWVTLNNNSGQQFTDASIKLMAGDVSKIQTGRMQNMLRSEMAMDSFGAGAPQVTEKSFDEFHLYSLARKVTLRDKETKQVEFMRGTNVKTKTLYLYDGAGMVWSNYRGWTEENLRGRRDFGTQANTKIEVVREFANTKENGLGLPLPAGKMRFYRQDDADGRLEFTGENMIGHTAQGEDVRISVGDAFDLVGDRKQLDYRLDNRRKELFETYEITLRNRKKEPVTITVQERLFRGSNWEITEKSDGFTKLDSRHITFDVPVKPDEERKVRYTVRYTW